jgi:hypothetical protein
MLFKFKKTCIVFALFCLVMSLSISYQFGFVEGFVNEMVAIAGRETVATFILSSPIVLLQATFFQVVGTTDFQKRFSGNDKKSSEEWLSRLVRVSWIVGAISIAFGLFALRSGVMRIFVCGTLVLITELVLVPGLAAVSVWQFTKLRDWHRWRSIS